MTHTSNKILNNSYILTQKTNFAYFTLCEYDLFQNTSFFHDRIFKDIISL